MTKRHERGWLERGQIPRIGRRLCERVGGSMQMLCRFQLVTGQTAYRQTR
jgi:hypothetical protein